MQAIAKSSPEPRWEIVGKTDEMTGTVTRLAMYTAKIGETTVEVEMNCPEHGADGGLLQVTSYDGFLATAYDEVLSYPSATARVDTGNGEVQSIALMQSDQYRNVYFLVDRGGVQMKNILFADAPALRDAPIRAAMLGLNGDLKNFKLELELDNGTKRVVRGDTTLGRYLKPCTAEAGEQRQQRKADEERQLREAAERRQKNEFEKWARAQGEETEAPNPTGAAVSMVAPPPAEEVVRTNPIVDQRSEPMQDYYSRASRRAGEEGISTVRACVGTNGALVGTPTITSTSGYPRLDEAAVSWASRGARFRPGTEDGQPVETCFQFNVHFQLGG